MTVTCCLCGRTGVAGFEIIGQASITAPHVWRCRNRRSCQRRMGAV